MPRNQYSRASSPPNATSTVVSEVVHASAAGRKNSALPLLPIAPTSTARNKLARNSAAKLPSKRGPNGLKLRSKDAKATGRRAGRPKCNESEWQILAEAAVDVSEILLGDGIHRINSLEDRIKLATKKAKFIREVVDHDDYDRLLRELPASTLPKITPGALLKWLDGEFKDVIDSVFFVDSAEEFANLLQTFAQGIASSFFGDKVRVTVKVDGPRRRKNQIATGHEVKHTVERDTATLAARPGDVSTQIEAAPSTDSGVGRVHGEAVL